MPLPKPAATERYAAKPGHYFDSTREEALSLIDPQGQRILDVGCGSGAASGSCAGPGTEALAGPRSPAQSAAAGLGNCAVRAPDSKVAIGMTGPPDLSVSVVSYNTRALLRACLHSLLARQSEGEATLEITVADNASEDGSPEMVRAEFPSVRLLEMGNNIGFGRANNAALEGARGRFFCLINSDAEALPHSLARARAYLDAHPDAGLVGGQLLWPDGSPQTSWSGDPTLAGVLAEQTFWGAWKHSVATDELTLAASRDVPQVCGAFMVIRREAFQQVGGFDPTFFMYNEDVDLNRRLRQAGWRLVFLPNVFIRHHHGASSSADWRVRARMVAANNQSRFYYFHRLEGPRAGRLVRLFCLLGTAIRLTGWSVLALVRPAARDKVKLFREVWRQTWAMTPSREEN